MTRPTLKLAVNDLLEALSIRHTEFLPPEDAPPHPFLPGLDFNRGHAFQVLNGSEALTERMAHKLRKRLQSFLEIALNDRKDMDDIVDERSRYSTTPSADRTAKLLMLLGAASRERAAPTSVIEKRKDALIRLKAQRAARGARFEETLLTSLDSVIEERLAKGNFAELTEKLRHLSRVEGAIVFCKMGRFNIVSVQTLMNKFGPSKGRRLFRRFPEIYPGEQSGDTVEIGIVFPRSIDNWTEADVDRFKEIILQFQGAGVNLSDILKAREGCTTVTLRSSREEAEALLSAFRSGELVNFGVSAITEPVSTPKHSALHFIVSGPPRSSATDPTRSGEVIAWRLRDAFRREKVIRPWRRLRFLFSPWVARSPMWHTIAESDGRAYASPSLSGRWKSLGSDLTMTLLLWPLLTAVLLGSALLPLSAGVIGFGVLTGLALAIVGAQPCSVLISPLACGAAIVAMGSAFGFAHAMIVSHSDAAKLFSRANVLHDFFLSVNGGLIGLSAPTWHQMFSTPLIAGLVGAIALSIGLAGWLMGQPQRAREGVLHRRVSSKEIWGSVVGAASGIGIGCVYGLDQLFRTCVSQPASLILAFVIVGEIWIGISTFIRFESSRGEGYVKRAISVGLLHGAVGGALIGLASWTAGSSAGPISLAASSGFFQSTFFTAAFVIGQRFGGSRAAFAATLLEGAFGFTGFVAFRILHG